MKTKRFGGKLRILRTQRKMTLQELAAALGYTTHSYLSEIEVGKKQPTVNLVLDIAELFQVSTDELLKDNLEPKLRKIKK
ncbi:MAG: helix-turn-helix transcriptional regulator [Chloroflexi bacterium]|nr:helix-turn-helix transcriptional regulator [Chloroflexota bacterium]